MFLFNLIRHCTVYTNKCCKGRSTSVTTLYTEFGNTSVNYVINKTCKLLKASENGRPVTVKSIKSLR